MWKLTESTRKTIWLRFCPFPFFNPVWGLISHFNVRDALSRGQNKRQREKSLSGTNGQETWKWQQFVCCKGRSTFVNHASFGSPLYGHPQFTVFIYFLLVVGSTWFQKPQWGSTRSGIGQYESTWAFRTGPGNRRASHWRAEGNHATTTVALQLNWMILKAKKTWKLFHRLLCLWFDSNEVF